MRRTAAIAAMLAAVAVFTVGCGSGSAPASSNSTRPSEPLAPKSMPAQSAGVGWTAPVTRIFGPRKVAAGVGRLPGTEGTGAKGCPLEEKHGEIGIFTDVSQPNCVRVNPSEPLLIVNRTGAYHRSEEHPITVTLGPYRTHLAPQEALRLAPAGRFLRDGYHQAKIGTGSGGIGVLVLPNDCAIFRPEPGEPLCFAGDRAGRLRRWRRTVARMGATACSGSDLEVTAKRHSSIGSGGTIYTQLFVKNRSAHPCTVAGVPEVVALGRGSRIVDVGDPKPLLKIGSKGGRLRVRIDPGRSATFVVTHYDGIGAGICREASVSGLRVTIPGSGPTQVVRPPMGYCPKPEAGLGLRVGRIE